MPNSSSQTAEPTLRIALLAFDGVEALDLAGPFEVFTTARRVAQRMLGANSEFADRPELLAHCAQAARWQVDCVARSTVPVTMRAGLTILPSCDFDTCTHADLLLIPGGVMDAPLACAATQQWLRRLAPRAAIVASVCTGVFLLAQTGVVQNERVTTHWEDIADLRAQYPRLDVQQNVRWVDEGPIVTSAGISAGIDMSLHLVARLTDVRLAARTARQMDTPWQAA